MATTNTSSLDQNAINDIARQIRGAVLPILAADTDTKDAKDEAQAKSQAGVSLRESIMIALADLSQKGQWSEREVSAAAAKAASMTNNKDDKSLSTFIGETKRAMHPLVRSYVGTLIDLRDAVWTAETEAKTLDKDAPAPLRKAFSRQYHLLIAMFGEAQEGNVFEDAASVIAFAELNNPDLDYKKVHKRLTKIKADLAAFYHDFPVDDIQLCVDTLNEVTEKALKNSRSEEATTVVAPAPVVASEEVQAHDVHDDPEPEAANEDEEDLLGGVLGEAAA